MVGAHEAACIALRLLAEAHAPMGAEVVEEEQLAVDRAPEHQLLAGAIVADATMDLLGLDHLQICPWALREGIILRHLDRMS